MKRFVLFVSLVLLIPSLAIRAAILNDSIPPGKNFDKAAFRLWYPDKTKTIKGVVVLVPGSNGDGRGLVSDLFWQDLATKHNFALLGCYFTDHPHDDMEVENYANAKEGSGQALLTALTKFAMKAGFPELGDAPLVLWGHSAGGEFNYEFVNWKPERVIAFVVNKGGFYFTALGSRQARNVPGIIFTGDNDLQSRKDILKGIFSINRRVGALWTFAEEPGAGHEIGQTQKLAGIFFNEVIPLRIHEKIVLRENSMELQPLSVNNGFAGNCKALSFKEISNEQKDPSISWLPTLKFAEAWLSFIKGSPFK